MAIRSARGSTPKPSALRLLVPTLLVLVFATTAVLLYNGSGHGLPPVGIHKTHLGSTHLHAYVARTLRALKTDPLKVKVDSLFNQASDQLGMVNAYATYARKAKIDVAMQVRAFTEQGSNMTGLLKRPENRALKDASMINEDTLRQFEKELKERIKYARLLITADAKELLDNQLKIQKLKDTIFTVTDQLRRAKKQGTFSSLIAAKSVPKSLHCLSMRLLEERISHPKKYAEDETPAPELEDPKLYHYAIFSDNILAVSVVINSVVKNAKQSRKHVFHVVTDKMNLWGMRVWFKMRPPNSFSHIEVKSVEDYKFLISSYVPVSRQLESAKVQSLHHQKHMHNSTKDPPNIKSRNPKYMSMLNNLRFYLAEMYPKLHRILFLDDDVVVQKDLTALWEVDMEGKVNAAVETCFGPFHRYSKYMNFSHPLIKEKFNPKACAWAYGMNLFDLDAWRRQNCTRDYHYWQKQNEDQTLWKLGTLPPGLITFYGTTKPLDKSWHVLGLGYNPNISLDKIKKAAVIHYNGNMKPWLDLAMNQYRDFWTKYVDYGMVFIQMCNFGH